MKFLTFIFVFFLLSMNSFSSTNWCLDKTKQLLPESKPFYNSEQTSSEVENYMKMHINDYDKAPKLWERTLHRPARRFIMKLFDGHPKKDKLHFVYIGAGREAPLFNDPEIIRVFREKVEVVTFVDISEEDLVSARRKLARLAPEIRSFSVNADITGGMAHSFDDALSRFGPLDQVTEDNTKQMLAQSELVLRKNRKNC